MSVVLREHLQLLSTAPDGIAKLRALILDLAVRGKLVPQDRNDEPASELLKQIAHERSRLQMEGICKKSKPVLPVEEDEQPFHVPGSWRWARLEAISQLITDGEHATPTRTADRSAVPLVTAKNVRDGYLDYTHTDFVPQDVAEKCWKRCKPTLGDILLVSVGATLGRLSILDHDKEMVLVRSVTLIRPCLVDRRYFAIAMRSSPVQKAIWSGVKQSAQPCLYLAQSSSLPIPLPPLTEQHRIVAKVDELMSLCDRLEAEQWDAEGAHAKLVDTLLGALIQSADAAGFAATWQRLAEYFDTLFTTESSIDALKRRVLQLAVMGKLVSQEPDDEPASELLNRILKERTSLEAEGKIKKAKPIPTVKEEEQAFVLPKTWAWVRFGSIADSRLGKMLDAAKNRGELKPYLRNTNVQWWQFDLEDVKEMRLTDDELYEFRLAKGDLLICEGGEPGRCAIWRAERDEMYFQKALHRARPFGGCVSEYLQIVLRQSAVSGVLSSYFTGATIKHFPGDKLTSFVLPLPPVAEQQRIVAKVDELMALCDQLKADLAESLNQQARLASTLIESALEAA